MTSPKSLSKSTVYSPKEILDADPNWTIPVKLGRGRMPTGGQAHVESLVAKGYKVKGYSVTSTAAPVADKPIAAPVVTKSVVSGEKVVEDFTIFYDEREYKAVTVTGNKSVGMREVCDNCHVSLVQNSCVKPAVRGIAVKIVKR